MFWTLFARKMPRIISLQREVYFWLMASEGSFHGCQPPWCWICADTLKPRRSSQWSVSDLPQAEGKGRETGSYQFPIIPFKDMIPMIWLPSTMSHPCKAPTTSHEHQQLCINLRHWALGATASHSIPHSAKFGILYLQA